MKLYIAYGSNLHKRQMRVRCPGARPLGKFLLTNARLVFRGVADVEYSPGDSVPCGLWSIDRQDEAALDRYEGVGSGLYYKEESVVLKYQGKPRNALVYLMYSEGVYPPSEHYAAVVRAGYRDFGLDERYLNEAIERSYEQKEPDQQTTERRERQRASGQRQLVKLPSKVLERKLDIKHNSLFPEEQQSKEKLN